jgi:hypothetical protein
MPTSLKYALHGYWLFDVNGRKFLTHASANRAFMAAGDASLTAWHWRKGWQGVRLQATHGLTCQ